MEKENVVAFDFHGVVANALGAKLAILREHTQLDIPSDTFNGRGVIGRSFKSISSSRAGRCVTEGDYEHMKARLYEDAGTFIKYLRPMPGAKETLEHAMNRRWQVRIVSNLKRKHLPKVHDWAAHYAIPFHEAYCTDGAPKSQYYAGCRAAIDDELRHLAPVVESVASPVLVLPCGAATGWAAVEPPKAKPRSLIVVRGMRRASKYLN